MRLLVRFVLIGVLLAPASVGAQGSTGHSVPEGTAWGLDGDWEVEVVLPPGQVGGSPSNSRCEVTTHDYLSYQLWWRSFPLGTPPDVDLILEDDGTPEAVEAYERPWAIVVCVSRDTGALSWVSGFQLGDPPDPGPIVERALDSMVISLPGVEFNPVPPAVQVVGIETWMWLDDASSADVSATACIPDSPPFFACATVNAAFQGATFDPGDDTDEAVRCPGGGVAYDPDRPLEEQVDGPHCGHVYLEAERGGSAYPVVATSMWHVTWDCHFAADLVDPYSGDCGSGDLGVIGRQGVPVPLDVVDLQAVAIPNQ